MHHLQKRNNGEIIRTPMSTKRPRTSKDPIPLKRKKSVSRQNAMFFPPNVSLVEKKDHGVFTQIVPAISVGTFTSGVLLNGIAQGDSAQTREGRVINMKKLQICWSWYLAAASTGGAPCRIKIVYDKQSNGAAPLITDILQNDDFHAFNNLFTNPRFVTLYDHITPPIAQTGDFCVSGKALIPMNLQCHYSGTGGTVGSINSGAIYLFAAQQSQIKTTAPALSFQTRIRYTDV